MIEVTLNNVSKSFDLPGGGKTHALKAVSVTLVPGEFTVLVGPNGSGKTTLLNLLAGSIESDTGEIRARIDGRDLNWLQLSGRARSRHVVWIHQNSAAGSVNDLDVEENMRLAALRGVTLPWRRAVDRNWRRHVAQMLDGTRLAGKARATADDLSLGQRQLLALELAAVRNGQLILLDEPTASLDRASAALCIARADALAREAHASTVLVTHDLALAAGFGDRLLVMQDGRIAHDLSGPSKQALTPEVLFKLCQFDRAPAVGYESGN